MTSAGADLNDLALFCRVARARSFTRAAQDGGVPLATISRRIAALERSMGTQLLKRSTRRVELTAAGEVLLERAEPAVKALLDAADCLGESTRVARGRLKVTMAADLAHFWLAAPLAEYSRRYPDVRLELDLSARRVDLIGENFDLAVRIGELEDSGLLRRFLARMSNGLYASPSYLAALPPIRSVKDLSQANALTLSARKADREWRLSRGRQRAAIVPTGNVAVTDMGVLMQLTVHGAGIALLPVAFAAEHAAAGRLQRVLPEWQGEPVAIHAVFAERRMPLRLRLMLDLLQAWGATQPR